MVTDIMEAPSGESIAMQAQTAWQIKKEDWETLQKTVAMGTTDSELRMFVHLCNFYHLDPFLKEIWCIKLKTGKLQIFTSRDGYIKIGHRSRDAKGNPDWDGLMAFAVHENDEFEIDAANYTVKHKFGKNRGKLVGAWAKADRKNMKAQICFVPLDEYYKAESDAWKKTPSAMIIKVAEVFVLRRQYEISGLRTTEEAGEEDADLATATKSITKSTPIETPPKVPEKVTESYSLDLDPMPTTTTIPVKIPEPVPVKLEEKPKVTFLLGSDDDLSLAPSPPPKEAPKNVIFDYPIYLNIKELEKDWRAINLLNAFTKIYTETEEQEAQFTSLLVDSNKDSTTPLHEYVLDTCRNYMTTNLNYTHSAAADKIKELKEGMEANLKVVCDAIMQIVCKGDIKFPQDQEKFLKIVPLEKQFHEWVIDFLKENQFY